MRTQQDKPFCEHRVCWTWRWPLGQAFTQEPLIARHSESSFGREATGATTGATGDGGAGADWGLVEDWPEAELVAAGGDG
jgi:hypothetical protein